EVHRQGVGNGDLDGLRANQPRGAGGELLVVRHPRTSCGEVTLDAELRPVIELLPDGVSHAARLKSQGVTGEVENVRTVPSAGEEEGRTHRREWVGSVTRRGPGGVVFERLSNFRCGHDADSFIQVF